ncbi:MAG: cyclodeaminase/cyclohydrolase family protein [Desulfomonile tiedjei]|uniref:Cyclodeaminase/cyclohydrolase family protein n=1 Tax=Desulfomonile tiedjei TaxID=2358 RepID=A0A9D6Z1P6_9BACT|nr:cyclodeaminase/cyclohydrolase family protein [Desulfomonile tiedjei]
MTDSFIEELSQPKPNPGGGAASAHGALLALGIVEKIVRLELRRDFAAGLSPSTQLLDAVMELKTRLSSLREEDSRAYLRLAEARALDPDVSQVAEALNQAIECPKLMMQCGCKILILITEIGASCKRHLVSDLQVSAELASAAVRGAFHIATANTRFVKDAASRADRLRQLAAISRDAETRFRNAQDILNSY